MRYTLKRSPMGMLMMALALGGVGAGVVRDGTRERAIELPNGFRVTPAGDAVALPGDMPVRMLLNGTELLVCTNGFHDQALDVVDVRSGKLLQAVPLGKTWTGMCATPDGKTIFLSAGGNVDKDWPATAKGFGLSKEATEAQNEPILRLEKQANGTYAFGKSLPIQGLDPKSRWVSGLAYSYGRLYAANMLNDTVYELDVLTGAVRKSWKVGYRPYGMAVSPDGHMIAVSNWGDRSVSFMGFDSDGGTGTRIEVGEHPTDLAWSPGGERLFVACAGGDSIAVVTLPVSVEETIRVTPDPTGPKVGCTPDALTMTADGNRLFVAEAGANCIAVVDTSRRGHSRVMGFIPTGWYPSAIAAANDGQMIYVGIGKGIGSRPNFPPLTKDGDTQPDGSGHKDYICDCLGGAVSVIPMPTPEGLSQYTKQVVENIPHPHANGAEDAKWVGSGKEALGHIKHVLYIIRENRTYDQVFGDIKEGNGDSSLTLFGEHITPNAHKLVQDMVLLDNFYCDGEVSEDGHEWCNSAYATDFKEHAYVNTYSGRGEPDADDRLTDSPGGYLWDNCRKHGRSYFSYGEFANFKSSPTSTPEFNGSKGLVGHASPEWSEDPFWGKRDTDRAKVFIDDLRRAERTGKWPQFMVMHLGEDHTQGMEAKAFSPFAHVASNDKALGEIVEAISHSRFWKQTAIFVLEDDAQDGPDHVDCHRSVALVISPYARRHFVDHTHYTTSSFVRTIELILGLPATTQFDSHATPLYRAFTATPDEEMYACLPALVDLEARNPATGVGAQESAMLDLSGVDRADPQKLNEILWRSLRPGRPLPAPVRSVSVR